MRHDDDMRFEHRTTYDASAAAVYAMLIDQDFRQRVSERQGALRTHVTSVSEPGDSAQIAVEQVLPAAGLPDIARKFIGNEITVRRSDRWEDARLARVDITIPDKPGSLAARLALTEQDSTTAVSIDGDLTVAIPFIGAKLEALVGDMFRRALDVEAEVARAWLADPA